MQPFTAHELLLQCFNELPTNRKSELECELKSNNNLKIALKDFVLSIDDVRNIVCPVPVDLESRIIRKIHSHKFEEVT